MISDARKPVTLSFWHVWSAETDGNTAAIQRTLANFAKTFPNIKLEVDATTVGYDTKIKIAMAANEAPDIFFSWGGGFSKPFVDAGKVLPLDTYISDISKGAGHRILRGGLSNFIYNGKTYAFPTSLSIGVLYCNRELFDRYRVKIPETYTELVAAVKKFKAKGVLPLAVGERDEWTGMFYYDILAIRTAGAKLCSDALNKKASFDRHEFTDAAAKLVELVRIGSFGKNFLNQTSDEAVELFATGKAAMLFSGTWVSGVLGQDDCPVKGQIEVRKFPVVEGASGMDSEYLGGAVDCFMVGAGTRYPKEAVMAAESLSEEMAKQSCLSGSGLPVWEIKISDISKINPLLVQQIEILKDSTAFVMRWDTFLTGAKAKIHTGLVQELFAGTISPEEYSRKMQKINQGQ
jgi:raffinose/stachyose/melibiose transport system substrate-binding protein